MKRIALAGSVLAALVLLAGCGSTGTPAPASANTPKAGLKEAKSQRGKLN